MNTVKIEGQLRSEFGKGNTRRLRAEGQVPGIIYGGEGNVMFSSPSMAFRDIVYSPKFQLAEIELDGKSYKCILKDVQFHPVTDELLHIDFLELVDGQLLNATIPLKFTGQSVGVKDGGRMVVKMPKVKVRTTPDKLVENLEVPIDDLEIGGNIRVEDIEAEGMEMMNSLRIPVVSVVTTRVLRQAAGVGADGEALPEGEEGAEGAEGESAEGAAEGGADAEGGES